MPSLDQVDALCRRTVARLIERARTGRHALRVPLAGGALRAGDGRHLHYTPEAFLQIDGWIEFDLPQERFRIRAGGICVMPAGTPHVERVGPRRGRSRHLVVMSTPDTIAWHLKEDADARGFPAVCSDTRIVRSPLAGRVIVRLAELAEAARGDAPGRDAVVQGLLLAYLGLVAQAAAEPARTQAAEPPRISRCRHEAMRRLADPALGVAGLARELGCSPNHLSTEFRRATGSTLVGWIRRQRMAQAQALLASTTLSVKEVGAAVGHRDPSWFVRVFRAVVGTTPKRWREHAT